jgi:hypothetical protein
MGAFITGLIGRAEQQRDKEEEREFKEGLEERQQKRKMVEYAYEEAVRKGDISALPSILGTLDDYGPPPGTPKGMKDPYKQLGTKLATMFGLRRRQQQQQQQRQQADQQYQQVTGQPPPGASGPVSPPIPPPSGPVQQAMQPNPMTQIGPESPQYRGFSIAPKLTPEQEASARATGQREEAANMRGMPNLTPQQIAALRETANRMQAVPGQQPGQTPQNGSQPGQPRTAAPAPPQMSPRMQQMVTEWQQAQDQRQQREQAAQIAKEQREEQTAVDKYGKEKSIEASLAVGTESRHYRQVQDRVEQLRAKNPDMDLSDAYAIAQGKVPAGGGKPMKGDIMPDAESPTGFSRIMMDHKGNIVGREQGILPPAGWAPSSATTYRFVPQPDGTFKAVQVTSTRTRQIPGVPPTNVRQPAAGAPRPPVPAPRPAGPQGGGPASQADQGAPKFSDVAKPGVLVGQKPPGEGEMAIAHGAQGAMESAAAMSKALSTIRQTHPMLVGQSMGRIASMGGKLNMIPGDMRTILADKDSVAAFIMGVHRARGRGYADKWAEVIGDPFINPEATKAVVERIGKIAEGVQKRILSANRYKPTTMEDIERQMDKEGAFDIFDQPPPGYGSSGTSGVSRGTSGPPPTRLNPYRTAQPSQ